MWRWSNKIDKSSFLIELKCSVSMNIIIRFKCAPIIHFKCNLENSPQLSHKINSFFCIIIMIFRKGEIEISLSICNSERTLYSTAKNCRFHSTFHYRNQILFNFYCYLFGGCDYKIWYYVTSKVNNPTID